MEMQPNALNRLIAARHLIDSSGQELTAISTPLTVAQKLLVAHDAAELVLLARITQLGISGSDLAAKQGREPSFMAIATTVLTKAYGGESEQFGQNRDLMDHLNRVRVAFKHQGLLPDTASSYHLFSGLIEILDNLCEVLLNRSLLAIDQTAAIHDEEIAEKFTDARALIDEGRYKEALEMTSSGLAIAFLNLELPSYVTPGEPSSEDALLLSGRGIDPASFLTMQKLLPVTFWGGEEAKWHLRKTGHRANWTKEKAEFCLRTAVSTVIRLQSAPILPKPIDFYHQFEDVVQIESENPEVYLVRGSMFEKKFERFEKFRKGDRIAGHAFGRHGKTLNVITNSESDLEFTEYIALRDPRHELIEEPEHSIFSQSTVLWFKSSEVSVAYQISESYEQWQRALGLNLASEENEIDESAR